MLDGGTGTRQHRAAVVGWCMDDSKRQNADRPKKGEKQADREARLAEALKANLRRRKAQSRARSVPADDKDTKRP